MATYLNKIKILDTSGQISEDSPFGFGIGTLREEKGDIVYTTPNNQTITLLQRNKDGYYTLVIPNGENQGQINYISLADYINSQEKFLKNVEYKSEVNVNDIIQPVLQFTFVLENQEEKIINIPVKDLPIEADNIYFTQDLKITEPIGKITQEDIDEGKGYVTLDAVGKSIEEVLSTLLTVTKNPITEDPSLIVSSSNIGSKEVGTKIKVQYSLAYDDGSYTYGPEPTGATVVDGTWKATFNGETINAQSGTFAEVQVIDDTSLSISGEVQHTAGSNPVTNIGNGYAAGAIKAGTKTGSKGTLTGYRKPFWGYKLTADALADPTAITSAQVRDLQKSGSSQAGLPTSYTIPADTKQVYFLAKAGTKNTISVKNESALNAPVAFIKVASGVQVKGANNYDATAYDLWYADFDNATTGDAVLKITWG